MIQGRSSRNSPAAIYNSKHWSIAVIWRLQHLALCLITEALLFLNQRALVSRTAANPCVIRYEVSQMNLLSWPRENKNTVPTWQGSALSDQVLKLEINWFLCKMITQCTLLARPISKDAKKAEVLSLKWSRLCTYLLFLVEPLLVTIWNMKAPGTQDVQDL